MTYSTIGFTAKITAAIVAMVAIALGSIASLAPHLFLKVPRIGFILFALTGGPLPPFIVQEPFAKGARGWLKKDDVIVSVAAKSGTTWMLFCSHQIRVKGNDEKHPFIDTYISTPWPGFIHTPGENWEIQREKMNSTILPDGTRLKDYWDHDDYPFRVFKSHDLPEVYGDLIGGNSGIKFLAMSRNGLDTVASMVPFFDNHSDEFRRLWGNFPPPMTGTMREEAAIRIKQLLPGGLLSDAYFKYVNSWWKVKNEKNVLYLHYSDAKKDLSGTVKRLADFYGVKLNAEEHETVVNKCEFTYMKKHPEMFNGKLPLNPGFDGTVMKHDKFLRKGTIGDGEKTFTEQERAEWTKAEEEMFGDDPEKLKWARGGEAIDVRPRN